MTQAPKNVVASVLARLRNVAQEGSISFNDILQSYVIERFLARLSRSPHVDTVLLKGALMLRVWGVPRARLDTAVSVNWSFFDTNHSAMSPTGELKERTTPCERSP